MIWMALMMCLCMVIGIVVGVIVLVIQGWDGDIMTDEEVKELRKRHLEAHRQYVRNKLKEK